jgi:hypothetical protein
LIVAPGVGHFGRAVGRRGRIVTSAEWVATVVLAIWIGTLVFTLTDMLRIPRSAWVRLSGRGRLFWVLGCGLVSILCIPIGAVFYAVIWVRSDDRELLRQWSSQHAEESP